MVSIMTAETLELFRVLCLAGSCLLLAADLVVAWCAHAARGWRRCLAYTSCPASQLAVVVAAALLARGGVIAPAWATTVALCGVVCAVYDVALTKTLVASERAVNEHARVTALAEQLEAQQAYAAERRQASDACRASYVLAADGFERMAAALDAASADGIPCSALDDAAVEEAADEERWCANEAVNAMLAFKERAVRMYGGAFDAQVMLPNALALPDVEVCALLSNAVDAALPALEHGAKNLRVRVYYAHGFLCVVVAAVATEVALPHQHALRVLKAFAARRDGDVACTWDQGELKISVLVQAAFQEPAGAAR